MPDLLHEYWQDDGSGSFGPVREGSDQFRLRMNPDARLVFSLYASSWNQAMQLRNERLGYGDYQPIEDDEDVVYTEEEKTEQDHYLKVRA
ncbi:hypothetical protein PQU92_15850 [Asticcacaulis sp. BYS171W]|uniref:Uncharacterized protein n=1 Tax=Asticcacaulis aquaticus TaxID=2984212 RepID=A0ABT5HXP0_9CAUL|nr:hypothetical protein [Asticcacaulis aquaticus]MDC7684759.1 hypothetical protein [Asticcacaulis aquaticus]